MRTSAWVLLGAAATLCGPPGAMAQREGSSPGAEPQPAWARWQGRLSLASSSEPWRLGVETTSSRLTGASLMGDYYFARPVAAPNRLGGIRATGGLVIGPRILSSSGAPDPTRGASLSTTSRIGGPSPGIHSTDTPDDIGAATYLGVGYTGLSPRNGWRFSADLGVFAQGAGEAARSGSSGPSLDDAVRDIRLRPVLQFGATYRF